MLKEKKICGYKLLALLQTVKNYNSTAQNIKDRREEKTRGQFLHSLDRKLIGG
jgi:hypothetical protein